MDSKEQKQSSKENYRKWQVSRRRLLQFMGAAGATAAIAPFLPSVFAKVSAGPSADTDPSATNGTGTARLRKWAMVIDLRRCDGCQGIDLPPQCTEACVEGHYAPEPMQFIQVYEHELHGEGTQFIPTPCMQCQNAPCVNVCPVGATFATPEGVILVDQQRCIGCRMCMAACPYDRRFFTWSKPPQPAEALFSEYDPEHQFPLPRGVTVKCNFCPHLARSGKLPYCAQACPSSAIYYGDLEEDIATNGAEVVKLSHFLAENQSYQLKADLGTKPRVYYIPGHGEAVGRSPYRTGRKPSRWPWQEKIEGAQTWTR
ncbi:MAG: 4Fe-4S dicluster domain-containing protein [Chloroflexi bacterium]|nr:4Fe-4S dicluster domain-containing protein [Chloroflexota bacterium]